MSTISSRSFYKSDVPPDSNAQTLLSRHDAAARLSISLATLDRLTRAGELPRIKLPGKVLYRPESLDAFARRKECWVASEEADSRDFASSGTSVGASQGVRQTPIQMPT